MRSFVLVLLVLFGTGVWNSARAQDGGEWFEVEAINPGLSAAGTIDRETPQATMESFLALTRAERFDEAAHLLDLREVPEDLRADVGAQLADRFATILQRRVWLDWGALPDRPDGLSIDGGKDAPLAGKPRRSLRLAVLDLGSRPVPLRMNRVKPANGDPVWLFSRQTVENIDALFQLYGPTKLERVMPGWLRSNLALGLELWEALLLPVLLLTAIGGGVLVYRWFGSLARTTDSQRVTRVAEALQLPVALTFGGFVFWLFINYAISFNGMVSIFVDPLVIGLFVLAAIVLVARVVNALLEYAVQENTSDVMEENSATDGDRDFYTNVSGARRLLIIILFLVGVGVVLSQTNILRNVGLTALGGASVLTLVLAFAGRAVLSNIMSSLQIAFSKPARIGDTLIYKDHWCVVERIHFTFVELRVWDQRLLIVPVNEFVTEMFENLSSGGTELIRRVFLVLDHRADLDAMRDAFSDWVERDDRVIEKETAGVEAFEHTREGVHVRFRFTGENPTTSWTAALELRELLLKRARELEEETGAPFLPVERELKVESSRAGIARSS